MAIPPFPCQDLAKLVLGYLIEEQLMTAYDEFLNESPYLDAQKNEYDRIMMNSLRNILAEYRAIKIYVETCKPIILRRRLFQCSNLLEVVHFLVRYIDVKKLQEDLSRDQVSVDSQEATTSRIGCDACHSLKLESCVCSNKRRNVSSSKSVNNSESIESGRSLAQATSLSDLPGNQDPENKHTKVPVNQINQSSIVHQQEIPKNTYPVATLTANVAQSSIAPSLQVQSKTSINSTNNPIVYGNTKDYSQSQNIADFNTVLNQWYNNNNSIITGSLRDNGLVNQNAKNNNRSSIAESFHDFTTGVRGATSSNVNIPDSSTTENMNMPLSLTERDQKVLNKRNSKTQQRKKCVFRVGNIKHDITEICSEVIDVDSVDVPASAPSNPKPDEPKVTILSNVKVGSDNSQTQIPKNATSTPLLQMQTIYINGTPIYNKPKPPQNCTYTRDEIMAMPTIILVPATGPSNVAAPNVAPTCVQPQTIMAQSSNVTTSTCHIPPALPPLTVDVSNTSSNVPMIHNDSAKEVGVQENLGKAGLVKTLEALKNASVPKDNVVSGSSSTTTPHMLPPQRKSSSTPRRTSHVRVLDFTTPRRNLNETISENPQQEAELDNTVEVMISKSPNVSFPHCSIVIDNTKHSESNIETSEINNTMVKPTELDKNIKKTMVRKKSNWDADLRALVASSEEAGKTAPSPKPKPKTKNEKKSTDVTEKVKNKLTINSEDKKRKKSIIKNNVPDNVNQSKKKDKEEITREPQEQVPSPTVSPIGIVSAQEKLTGVELQKLQNKSNDEDRIDTPEVERLSLRNEIGAKLNISDILETPYKQALYDIQMETPRFLGPDLPGDPMSDIKITDIPTPRFLSTNMPFTPKPTQPTPSSYSSRPTDYSSGGSYYKPDDQDYLPILEDVACPVTSSHSKNKTKVNEREATTEPEIKESQSKEKPNKRNRSRPVRQCTKNVSYYKMINKQTDGNNKDDDASSCSDTISANSSLDSTVRDDVIPKSNRIKQSVKSGNRRNLSISKKRSPLKKTTQKPFMKIKPRRSTPTKASRKCNRKSSESQVSLKGRPRVRNTSKVSGDSSLVVPALTKSRRKSSTPRKLHCTKTFNTESSGHESPETETKEVLHGEIQISSASCVQDSDTEQLPLRWSDDGSQDMKLPDTDTVPDSETDEISKIKEYIHKTVSTVSEHKDNEGSLQNHLVKRGFDLETAKIIERDLLNTPVDTDSKTNSQSSVNETKNIKALERSVESDCSTLASNLVINEDDDSDDLEFSIHECNEESANYLTVHHDDSNKKPPVDDLKLKDKFSMEICIDDGFTVRLRATPFNYLFNQDPQESRAVHDGYKETEMAVSSISNMDKLYTPMKDPVRAQCYEIFDSTLTSIDTPLKADSPIRKHDASVSEIVLDDIEVTKEKNDSRKRKRLHCSTASDESVNDNKRVKPETELILQSKDIKNIDIEVLLTKLHGS